MGPVFVSRQIHCQALMVSVTELSGYVTSSEQLVNIGQVPKCESLRTAVVYSAVGVVTFSLNIYSHTPIKFWSGTDKTCDVG